VFPVLNVHLKGQCLDIFEKVILKGQCLHIFDFGLHFVPLAATYVKVVAFTTMMLF